MYRPRQDIDAPGMIDGVITEILDDGAEAPRAADRAEAKATSEDRPSNRREWRRRRLRRYRMDGEL